MQTLSHHHTITALPHPRCVRCMCGTHGRPARVGATPCVTSHTCALHHSWTSHGIGLYWTPHNTCAPTRHLLRSGISVAHHASLVACKQTLGKAPWKGSSVRLSGSRCICRLDLKVSFREGLDLCVCMLDYLGKDTLGRCICLSERNNVLGESQYSRTLWSGM